jgi:hypothetical protein
MPEIVPSLMWGCPVAGRPRRARDVLWNFRELQSLGAEVLLPEPQEHPVVIAFAAEYNSAMPRSDNLADLAAFVVVADTLNFRAAASRSSALQ